LTQRTERSPFKGLDLSLLELIVRSDELRLESEDSLLSFILSLGSENQAILLRFLRSEYLSSEGMELLLSRLDASSFDLLLWESLCRRLLLRPTVEILIRPAEKTGEVEGQNGAKLLNGIISYLTKKYRGNVHEKGIVTITSKSVDGDPDYPRVPTNGNGQFVRKTVKGPLKPLTT
jgi:hypothetical protein